MKINQIILLLTTIDSIPREREREREDESPYMGEKEERQRR